MAKRPRFTLSFAPEAIEVHVLAIGVKDRNRLLIGEEEYEL
jgi:hypothetical protein